MTKNKWLVVDKLTNEKLTFYDRTDAEIEAERHVQLHELVHGLRAQIVSIGYKYIIKLED